MKKRKNNQIVKKTKHQTKKRKKYDDINIENEFQEDENEQEQIDKEEEVEKEQSSTGLKDIFNIEGMPKNLTKEIMTISEKVKQDISHLDLNINNDNKKEQTSFYAYCPSNTNHNTRHNINTKKNNSPNSVDKKENNDKKNNESNIFLNNLFDIFKDYDEIKIKINDDKEIVIDALLKINDNEEIKYKIIYNNTKDFFNYYSVNISAKLEGEDEAFYDDLFVPKNQFFLLVQNFKKYKILKNK